MHLYGTHYSRGTDASLPQFRVAGKFIYPTHHNTEAKSHIGTLSRPWFEMRNNKIYTTSAHPQGRDLRPWFQVNNNKVTTTAHHPDGRSRMPVFHIKKY
ncbi:MAG TPA: hypothetical protein VEB60_00475 [Candidatus Paceibacterota bacterium]|nr:hypothetical protein [Candidatus Paceibacterota bacterium]